MTDDDVDYDLTLFLPMADGAHHRVAVCTTFPMCIIGGSARQASNVAAVLDTLVCLEKGRP